MKKTLFCIFTLFVCVGIFAQNQPVVAVAPFDIFSNAVTAEQASMINDVFFVRLGNTRRVGLVNRSIVDRILREHHFQAGDWSNENKTAELAKALNADWIVQGNIRKSGSMLLIIIQFYDIKTFKFEGGTDILLTNVDEVYGKMDPLVNSLIEIIFGSGSRTSTTINQPTAPVVTTNRTYNIGDVGPAGGIIFYDRGFVADGWRYLEAAPAGTDFPTMWGMRGRDVTGTDRVIGSGRRNTQLIVERLNQSGEANRAAQVCLNMDINGYKDWFLPSRDELDLLYQNLHRKRLGGFNSSGVYWSSTQSGENTTNALRFSDGAWNGASQGNTYINFNDKNRASNLVRAIRSF